MFETPEQDEVALEIAIQALRDIIGKTQSITSAYDIAKTALDKIKEECES